MALFLQFQKENDEWPLDFFAMVFLIGTMIRCTHDDAIGGTRFLDLHSHMKETSDLGNILDIENLSIGKIQVYLKKSQK